MFSILRLLLTFLLLLAAMPGDAQVICEPKTRIDSEGKAPVATRGSGGEGCDFGEMGIFEPDPPMPAAQLQCVRLEGAFYLMYRCAAHPRGNYISYQWTTSTVSPYITLEPESDPGIAVLTCNSPPNLWLSANVTATVLGPLNQGSTQMLDVDCTRYEPLNFP